MVFLSTSFVEVDSGHCKTKIELFEKVRVTNTLLAKSKRRRNIHTVKAYHKIRGMIPLILLNYEKILHTGNITTYQKTLYPDGNSINSKILCFKKEIERNFLERNTFSTILKPKTTGFFMTLNHHNSSLKKIILKPD